MAGQVTAIDPLALEGAALRPFTPSCRPFLEADVPTR